MYPETAGYQRRECDTRSVHIKDIRNKDEDFNLDKNGFQLVMKKWTDIKVNDVEEQIKRKVYPESVELLKYVYVLPIQLWNRFVEMTDVN